MEIRKLRAARRRLWHGLALLLAVVVGAVAMPAARAGLTASEVIVVVNAASTDSRTLANHFVSLRGIPAINVIVLDQISDAETISVEEFRTKILRPLLTEISRRRLTGHFQCIAYSADFPTAIDISEDLKQLEKVPQFITSKGSLNGLTYLYQNVLSQQPYYADLNANFYARRSLDTYLSNPAGTLTAESWLKIETLIGAGDHSEASRELEKLHDQQPHQFPMLYYAAAEAALANEPERAIKLLKASVNAGWNAGGYMALDERLDGLRDLAEFQILELLVDDSLIEFQPSTAFDTRTYWTPNGIPVPVNNAKAANSKYGLGYMLSTVLGVTRGNGTTLSQAIDMLRRSASADFTHPEGAFYFCATKDIRSTTRQWGFLDAVDTLKSLGYAAEIITDPLPQNKPAVLGVQSGTPGFSWSACRSQFVPGAIADNLTSFGGIMTPGASQTKLTEFIKFGAAGSSGTVIEPYSMHQKFPLPQMYVHYARGASLAEAFYMSVAGPYQLLIIGDPLCRPFSNAPNQDLAGEGIRFLKADGNANFELDLSGPTYEDWVEKGKERAKETAPFRPAAVSVLVDGTNPQTQQARPNLTLHVRGLTPGYHEVTLRFASRDPLVQKNESVVPLWIGDRSAISLSVSENYKQPTGKPFKIIPADITQISASVMAPGSKHISLWHEWEQLAVSTGDRGEFTVQTELLGKGPVRLQARAEFDNGQIIQTIPMLLEIE